MSLNYPPSLPPEVMGRAWRASNGELGIMPSDAEAFLDACERDSIQVLGWELWLVDHWLEGENTLVSRSGIWTGLIPDIQGAVGVWASNADLNGSRDEIRRVDWRPQIQRELHDFVRYNFTLDV
jgi:hypothetical protein